MTTDFSESETADSINMGIDLSAQPAHCMRRILDLAMVTAIIDSSGQEAFLWFADLEAAYRQLAVALRRLWLQGHLWQGKFYLDLRAVFGDACLVHKFTRVSNLVIWLWRHRSSASSRPPESLETRAWLDARRLRLGDAQASLSWAMMYIDDVAGVSTSEAHANGDLGVLFELLTKMGLPVSHAKVFRPARRGETRGGELDLDKGTVDLSETFIYGN